jgi:N-dimethylarginine dimethylaminohydrolase
LIDYVETWFKDWVGYSEESVFDVNVLNIDEKNVIVNGYNKTVFDTFERYGITAHICPIRHRYFWDGGIHCVTLDLDRLGSKKDWFPDRG